jgi:hypothetical protein
LEIANCLKQARTQQGITDLAQPSGFAQILVQRSKGVIVLLLECAVVVPTAAHDWNASERVGRIQIVARCDLKPLVTVVAHDAQSKRVQA